jgi:vancomycin resistance protein YoaR
MALVEASIRPSPLRRALIAASWLVTVAALVVGALAIRTLMHRNEVMPGVRVLGTELTGLTAEEAGIEIRRLTAARLREPAALDVGVSIEPAKLFTLDRGATVAAALDAGRGDWSDRARSVLAPLTDPVSIEPRLVVRPNAEARLEALLRRFAKPPVSANVRMVGLEPVVQPARSGTVADVTALLARLEERVVDGGRGAVDVSFRPAAPAVDDDAARAAAEEARLVVSAPVALTFDAQPIGQLSPLRLARTLTFAERGNRLLVLFDEERLARVLDPSIAPFERRAANAQFGVDGARAWVVPSRQGLTLDPAAAVVAVTTAAHERGERAAALSLRAIDAELTTAEAQALGIRERISTFTTEMGPSSSNRIHNVHLMADYIDGTIVRPGEAFSFNERVGPRTEERGFREGQMIVGSLLLPSIGGGVCQTATTLFNNAFEIGLPILERHNHSFYISHYPLGRDATVSWGGPDFRFRNDMEHALLIKASYTDATLTFSFYGTDEGREVTARTGERTNWKEPERTYALDPAAPRGSVRLVRGDYQRGFDVTVYRTVKKGGNVIREDSFSSQYIPVGETEVHGPGTTIPGPYFVIPTT